MKNLHKRQGRNECEFWTPATFADAANYAKPFNPKDNKNPFRRKKKTNSNTSDTATAAISLPQQDTKELAYNQNVNDILSSWETADQAENAQGSLEQSLGYVVNSNCTSATAGATKEDSDEDSDEYELDFEHMNFEDIDLNIEKTEECYLCGKKNMDGQQLCDHTMIKHKFNIQKVTDLRPFIEEYKKKKSRHVDVDSDDVDSDEQSENENLTIKYSANLSSDCLSDGSAVSRTSSRTTKRSSRDKRDNTIIDRKFKILEENVSSTRDEISSNHEYSQQQMEKMNQNIASNQSITKQLFVKMESNVNKQTNKNIEKIEKLFRKSFEL